VLAGRRFHRYASAIDAFPDGSFDVVLVDGRARPACIRHGARKVRVGGWLILDNAEREYYVRHVQADLADFNRRSFRGAGPVNTASWQTDVFVRRG
jgi:predicted O-methyltransferase YrrM